ncbi:MAG: hypothetical protein RLY16_2038, partial [Bacteroidota bacterium]
LTAGTLVVSVSDWFFLRDKPVVHYVGLSDVNINLHRKDSVWNYQFLADYFGGGSSNKKKSAINLDLKEVNLRNIHFKQVDGWVGEDRIISLQQMVLKADTIDINKKFIKLSSLYLDAPQVTLSDYTGERDRLGLTKPKLKDTTHYAYRWNNDGWVITADKLQMKQGLFRNIKESDHAPYINLFDADYIEFGKINADVNKVRFEKDTLQMQLQLATHERSGFEVKKLAANFKFTPEMMEFKKLKIETGKSTLGDYYVMRYDGFLDDMSRFMHKVKLEGNFVQSEVHSDDIAFFAPELKSWNRLIKFEGQGKGTIDDLDAKNMKVRSGSTFIDGSISLAGLPDIDNTFIDFTANELRTNFAEACNIIPPLRSVTQPNLHQLGNISYTGKFTGFLADFVSYGKIQTALGTVNGDINLKLPSGKPPIYQGRIATDGFDIGTFLEQKELGEIACTGKIKGSGFTMKTLKANFDGEVKHLIYNGYPFQNIAIRGDFNKKLFTGHASIQDPNLKIEYLTGTIDLNGAVPVFDFDARLKLAALKYLNLTKDDYDLAGDFRLQFAGNNIDNFLGTARIQNADLLHDEIPLSFDSLLLESTIVNGEKSLTLRSNEVDANVTGKFKILQLPEAFMVFLHRYYPAYIRQSNYNGSDQDFSFEVNTKIVDPYIQLMDKKLEGFNNASVKGSLKLSSNEFEVQANVPSFSYDHKVFSDIQLNSIGNLDSLATNVQVSDIALNDSVHMPSTRLHITSSHDTSMVSINTGATKAITGVTLNARVQTLSDGASIHFFPSSFTLSEKKWQLEKDGEISIRNNLITANDVKLVQGNQQINISTEPSGDLEKINDIIIQLEKVNANDFLPYVFTKPRLEGLVTGEIRIENPFGKPFLRYDAKVSDFRNEGDSIGTISSTGVFDTRTKKLTFKANADNEKMQFNVDGVVGTDDSTAHETLINIQSDKFNLAVLNTYLGDIFNNIKGMANTKDLKLVNHNGHLTFTGIANLEEGSLVVNYTQCKYLFKNESVIFNPDEIDFGDIQVRDTLGNTGTLSGRMYHQFFDKVAFDQIEFVTNRMLVLNTTKKDNAIFFGKVIGRANFKLNGSADNMVMDIGGEPTTTDTSQIYILSGNSIDNGTIDYIDFIQYGKQMEDELNARLGSRILLNMHLIANTACKIDVVLDEATGDVIKGVGTGELDIRVGNKEPLSIKGRYDITRGDYTFNFQTVLEKYFTVKSGSIIWNGDPFKANIDIITNYRAGQVDFSALSNNFRQKEDIIIEAHLTQTLLKPAIDFRFQVPDGSPVKNNFEIIKRLEQFQQDKNDLNKQVTSILLFGTFINSSQGFITASSGYNVLANTIGGVVSGAISGFFNKVLQKYIKNLDFNIDVNSSMTSVNNTDLQSSVQRLQAAANSNLIYTVLNGRLVIKAGVNLDYNNPYANLGRNTNLLVTPDITAEWILSKDGRVRVVAFNKTNLDVIGQRNRTGASISYRKEADRIAALFLRDEKKKKTAVVEPVPPKRP